MILHLAYRKFVIGEAVSSIRPLPCCPSHPSRWKSYNQVSREALSMPACGGNQKCIKEAVVSSELSPPARSTAIMAHASHLDSSSLTAPSLSTPNLPPNYAGDMGFAPPGVDAGPTLPGVARSCHLHNPQCAVRWAQPGVIHIDLITRGCSVCRSSI